MQQREYGNSGLTVYRLDNIMSILNRTVMTQKVKITTQAKEAARHLKNGLVVSTPLQRIYAFAWDTSQQEATDLFLQVKKRDPSKYNFRATSSAHLELVKNAQGF